MGHPVPQLRFNDIADRILEYDPTCDLALLQRAYVFSAKVHEGQERLSGEPYLIHPLAVAAILVDLRMDEATVAAGLLHDTLEDTLTTADELKRLFGEQVTFLVDGLTKIARVEFKSSRERQAENFRKMLLAMSSDIRILLIKLADRLHNMRTLDYVSEDRRRQIAQETQDIYVPLAHRLGIHWMKHDLEDLSFRVLEPVAARDLERRLKSKQKARSRYIDEVKGVLSARLADASLSAEVTGRLKDLASIHAKMQRDGVSLDEIYDVIAFRIIVPGGTADVYSALGIVHAIWRPVPGRFKDYVALPKANGYQSLHTTVIGPYGERMEVQIRTQSMHRDAELGIAAHWKYKSGKLEADADDSKFAWLRQLVERHRDVTDPNEFIETVKVDLFPDEVFVFTPRGDVIGLPVGATPVDFAYAIHSEVGDSCAGREDQRQAGVAAPQARRWRHGRDLDPRAPAAAARTGSTSSSRARRAARSATRSAPRRSRAVATSDASCSTASSARRASRCRARSRVRASPSSLSDTAAARSTTCSRRWATAGSRRPRSCASCRAAPRRRRPSPRRAGACSAARRRARAASRSGAVGRDGALRRLLRAAARRRGGRLRHARPRRHRAPEGLPEGVRARSRAPDRRRSGSPTPQTK
jgi:ppGpp synthetase/RelA/SpoT-type nucleotidyltranferase